MEILQTARQSGQLNRAFWNQYNLILLAGVVLFSIAFASFLPLLIGVAAEAIWLAIGARLSNAEAPPRSEPGSPRASLTHAEAALAQLEPSYQSRFAALGLALDEIRSLYLEQTGVSKPELEAAMAKLHELRGAFIKYAGIHQRVTRYILETPVADLEREVHRLTQQLTAEKDLAVRVTVRHALSLAERRLAQREVVANTRRAVEVRMETLEQSFAYIKSRILGLGSGPDLFAEIEALMNQVGSVAALEAEIHDSMRSTVTTNSSLRSANATTGPGASRPRL